MSIPLDNFQLKAYLALVIQRLAKEKGLRQAHLGRAMGRKPGVVSQWWRGKVMPDTDSLIAIAAALDTTHARLMEEAEGLRDAAARGLQSSTTTAAHRSAASERRLAKQEYDRAWLQVAMAFKTRKEYPGRWEDVKRFLDTHIGNPQQERTDYQNHRRAGMR